MKALLYKEFKLAMHPICYVFVFMFPFMVLIPSYPLAIGFIYILSCYPILFLGANKGQQSNDLLYSTLLPIRKKDIVKARIITVSIMQFTYVLMLAALFPLAWIINQTINVDAVELIQAPGIPLEGYVSILAIGIIGLSIADIIFFPIYYKNGRSIVKSTLFTILGFVAYLAIFTIASPYIPGCEGYVNFLANPNIGIQFAILGGALVLYVIIHIFVYKLSFKRLENVDF